MKIAVIGAGNMGGAIVKGLLCGKSVSPENIWVANPSRPKLDALQSIDSRITITTDNQEAVSAADWVVLAVKPWLIEAVIKSLTFRSEQVVVSIAAGVTFDQLTSYTGGTHTLFRVMPNTAISEQASMTLISSYNATREQEAQIVLLFAELGRAMIVPEAKMAAATILASCGIAYVLKYIHAATEAGVEMGIAPHDAMIMVAKSVEGAAKLILNNDTHPAVEIDKVTTPGGITIKGLNTLEHTGFSSAIIQAMKSCL